MSSDVLPLRSTTSSAWARLALADPLALLDDHAHLERKAAANALALLTRWPATQAGGNAAEHWARVLGKRIGKVDVKDRGHAEFGDPKQASKTARGTDGGEVNWAGVRKELRAIDYTGFATAEVKGGDRHRLARMAAWMDHVLGN